VPLAFGPVNVTSLPRQPGSPPFALLPSVPPAVPSLVNNPILSDSIDCRTSVMAASVTSSLCDLSLILALLTIRACRRKLLVRILGYFAACNFAVMALQMSGLIMSMMPTQQTASETDGSGQQKLSDSFCTGQAAAVWGFAWASWLWCSSYAWTVHHSLHNAFRLEAGRLANRGSLELRLHALCWGLPALAVLVGTVFGFFGGTGWVGASHFDCIPREAPQKPTGSRNSHYVRLVLAWGVAMLAIGCNSVAFVSVHRLMRRSAALVHDGIEQGGGESVSHAARLQLWPRFAAYSTAFIGSTLPSVALLIVDLVAGTSLSSDSRLGCAADTFGQLHGAFNLLIFMVFNARFFREAWGCIDTTQPPVRERLTEPLTAKI